MKGVVTGICLALISVSIMAQEPARKTGGNIPEGYGDIAWGTMLTPARDKIQGKLYFSDEKSVIISRDGELEYLYGFLYMDPAKIPREIKNETENKKDRENNTPGVVTPADGNPSTNPPVAPAVTPTEPVKEEKKAGEPRDEGKLFYVALKFPYLAMKDVQKKLTEKYGPSTSENLSDFQGAMAWSSEKTIIIMWVDRYEKKPYCRRITYISREISRELNEYVSRVFNKTELEIIRKLNP
jgi:hypothetical protein